MMERIASSAVRVESQPESDGEELARRPGRPKVHNEEWSKVTVVLLNRQIVFLDRLCADVRSASGLILKRAEVIRALVDALAESGFDTRDIHGEEDVRLRLKGLRPGPNPSL
jgi:hypothetical protein